MAGSPAVTGFDSLLVANRGEVAVRVIRTARRLGLRTIAVYSDADSRAPHVRAADEAVRIGPARAADSYLSVSALLAAAVRSGAAAVHPGYGFLSENAEFARAVRRAGLVFVGPPADVIDLMGRKDHARRVAVEAGVPVLAAVPIPDPDADASALSELVGAGPWLIKAAAGGGGRGMRAVHDRRDLPEAVRAARLEALASFGDGSLLVEPFVPDGRHIEVQVLADEHGGVVHLGERDCSTQRRHQKVIEEAPAPMLSATVRAELTDAAVALARAVGYRNAGTVEFLVRDDQAYFLEMNTRLQVEHAVTEMVTGLDLVALQLAVADGRPLPMTQDEVRFDGHAIEVRVYAEDAFGGFVPQAGVAALVRWPARARVDAALEPGQVVGTDYDPMLGKVIVHRATRAAARRAMVDAIDAAAVVGVTTNLGFLRSVLESPQFRDGLVRTSWLDDRPSGLAPAGESTAAAVAAWARLRLGDDRPAAGGPFDTGDGWRPSGPPAPGLVEFVDLGGFTVRPDDTVEAAAGVIHVLGHEAVEGGLSVRAEAGGRIWTTAVRVRSHAVDVAVCGHTYTLTVADRFDPARHSTVDDGVVRAPMPGAIVAVDVAVGDRVVGGDLLGLLEAMKMQMPLRAPFDGVVARVPSATQVALGDVLFAVDPGGLDEAGEGRHERP